MTMNTKMARVDSKRDFHSKMIIVCHALQHAATLCNTLQHRRVDSKRDFHSKMIITPETHCKSHCNTLQHTATHCSTLQRTATHCNTLQHTTTHCNTLQHTATHCNTLQHTATPPLSLLYKTTIELTFEKFSYYQKEMMNTKMVRAKFQRQPEQHHHQTNFTVQKNYRVDV